MADDVEIKAIDADFLLNHPLLKKAFDDAREEMVQSIEEGLEDKAARDGVMIGLQLLKTIRGNIYAYIEDAIVDKQQHTPEEY